MVPMVLMEEKCYFKSQMDSFSGNTQEIALGTLEGGDVNITTSENTGNISGSHNLGGLIGYSSGEATLLNVSNVGNITGSSVIGGIIGYAYYDVRINYAFNGGDLTSNQGSLGSYESLIGGIVGYAREGLFLYQVLSYVDIYVNADNLPYGYIVGNVTNEIDIDGVYYYGDLLGGVSNLEIIYGNRIINSDQLTSTFLNEVLNFDPEIWSYEFLLEYFQ